MNLMPPPKRRQSTIRNIRQWFLNRIFTSTPCASTLHLHPFLLTIFKGKNLSLMWVRERERAHGVPIMEGSSFWQCHVHQSLQCHLYLFHCPHLPFPFLNHSYIALPPFLKPNDTMSSSSASSSPLTPAAKPCAGNWSISDDSLKRYVSYASESCIQELLSASESSRAEGFDGWKVLSIDDGVEISKRRSGLLHVFRSRWLLRSVSPQQFISVANAIDAAKQWDPDLVEANYIKALSNNLSIIRLRFGDASKPLFKNREFIVYERRETMDDGTLVVAVASLPKEIAAGLQPKRSNSIRGLLLQSGWVVEKLEDDSCLVTYVVQLDPAGWLPKCFVNRLNTKLVMIVDNLEKLAQACPVNSGI